MAEVDNVIDAPLVLEPVVAAFGNAEPATVCNLHILLVDREPVFYPIAEAFKADPRVMLECIDSFTALPAPKLFFDPERHVIVIQGDNRFNPMIDELVNQLVVEGDALFVDLAVGRRDDARPGKREPIAREAAFRHKGDVFFEMMVMIGCDAVISERLLCFRIKIDCGTGSTAFIGGALYLPCRA